MGSLQTKGNRYYVVISTQGGKQKWISTGLKTKPGNYRKAKQYLTEVENQYNTNPSVFETEDFVSYARKWLKEIQGRVDPITYEAHKQHLEKHIIPYFQPLKLKLQEVTREDINAYFRYKSESGRLDGKEGGLERGSIKRHASALNQIFEEALKNHLIKENPCRYAEIPRQDTIKHIDVYTVSECEKLLEVTAGTDLHDMILITYMYGLRRSELMGLRWRDIDFDCGTVAIRHTAVVNGIVERRDKTKNKSSNRVYPMLDNVREVLLRRKQKQEENRRLFGNCYYESDYVFTKEDGNLYYPDYPTKRLKTVLERNGLRHIRFHDLRHSCVTMLMSKNWSMKDISDWLGHVDISTTMNIYAHLSIEHKREMGKTLNTVFANKV